MTSYVLVDQSELDYRFVESVRNERISNVERALQTGQDVKQRDIDNFLIEASCKGNLDYVKKALQNGANLNAFDETEFGLKTCLWYASENRHNNVVYFLLHHGADPNFRCEYGRTCLHHAAMYGYYDVVKILIEKGNADYNSKDEKGNKPINLAERFGQRKVLRYLTDIELHLTFKKGLHKGTVSLTNLRLVLMGPPCVGKTSFKSLLFNWPAPEVHNSTALATRPIRAIERVTNQNKTKIWERVTGLDLLNMLSDAIRALEQEFDDKDNQEQPPKLQNIVDDIATTKYSSQPTSNMLLISHQLSEVQNIALEESCNSSANDTISTASPITSHSLQQVEEADSVLTPVLTNTSTPAISQNETITDIKSDNMAPLPYENELTSNNPSCIESPPTPKLNVDNYSADIIKVLEERKTSKGLHKASWIHILDSGGQPQFADVSRAFLRCNSINIICTNLSEKLSDKPQFSYSLGGKLLNQPSELQMTNLQLIEHFVRSVVASKNKVVVKGNQSVTTKPLFIIVGTKYDKVSGIRMLFFESLRKKNAQILSSLHEFRDHFIFYKESSQELIHPVDNLCRLNREKISASIRERMVSYMSEIGFTIPIPVSWYMFEIRVKEEASQEEHGMLSLESCCNIGDKFEIKRDDLLKAITYLHSMALFLYFPVVLPNVIFTNPQYLLDMLSSLIRVSFVDLITEILPEGQSISPDTQRLFRENGIFEESLVDKLCLPFVSSLFMKSEFLELLQYLCIIASVDSTDSIKRYFMPVVLPPCQAAEDDISIFTTTCDPLIITFESEIVPQGVFPAVVVSLVGRKKKPKFFIDSRSPTFPRQLRYAILLYSDDLFGSILLVDQFYWMEVYYNGLPKNCFKLRDVICEAITTCANILAYDKDTLNAEVSVPCKQEHRLKGHKSHPVILSLNEDPPAARCSIEKELPTLLLTDSRQTCWFVDSKNTTSSTATNKETDENVDIIPVCSSLPDGPLDECHLSLLVMILKEVEDWEILGIHLGIKDTVIKDIKAANFFQPAPSRKDMLVKWLKGGRANRTDFIKALRNIDEHRIACEIESATTT